MMRIGLLPQERAAAQRVLIGMKLYVEADYLSDVDENSIVDYGAICARILEWEKRVHVELIETLAQDLLEIAFSYAAVCAAQVSVQKPDIIGPAKAVGIEVFRDRLA